MPSVKPTVYVKTTVISYLTAWPSRDLIRVAQQQTTREWWDRERQRFEVYTSELVEIEASAGDPQAAADRLAILAAVQRVAVSTAAVRLGDELLNAGAFPRVASRDALHVAICATNGLEYLLTWNFRHLANAQMQDSIRETCVAAGYAPPVICSPDALFEDRP